MPGEKSSALSELSRHRSGRFGKALGAWFSHAIRNIKHYSHLFPRWELLCFPFPAGLGEKMGPPLCKNALVHNGRAGPCQGKNLPHFPDCPAITPGSFRIVPPSPRAVWEGPWGLNFHEIRNIKDCSHLFSSMGAFVFPIPSGIGGKDGATPLQKCIGA